MSEMEDTTSDDDYEYEPDYEAMLEDQAERHRPNWA